MARRRTYPGTIEKRGEAFWVDLVVSGTRFRKTLRGVTREQAEAFLRQKHEEMKADTERGTHGLPLGDGTVLALIDDFRADHFPELESHSRSSYDTTLKLFSTWLEMGPRLRSLAVRDVSPRHVRNFLTWVRNNSYAVSADTKRKVNPKPHTIRHHRAALHKMFNYAVNELELRDYNPVSKVKTKKPDDFDPVILDDHEYERRDGDQTTVVRSPWVFHHLIRRRHAEAGSRFYTLRRSLKAAARDAGIEFRWRLHDLRHRRATTWIAAGKSPVKVQQALGHSSIQTTMKYTHLVKGHLRTLVEDNSEDMRVG